MTGPLWAGALYAVRVPAARPQRALALTRARGARPCARWPRTQLNSNARYVFGTAAGFSLSAALLEVLLWRRMVPHPSIEAAAAVNAIASRSSLALRLGSPQPAAAAVAAASAEVAAGQR